MSSYLIALLLALAGPLLLSFHPNVRKAIWFCPKRLLFTLFLYSFPFWVWDVVVTERGHWSFSKQHTLGVFLWRLPLEEWFFFPVVGFIFIFLWEVVGFYQNKKRHA